MIWGGVFFRVQRAQVLSQGCGGIQNLALKLTAKRETRLGRPTWNLGFRVPPSSPEPSGAAGHHVSLSLAPNKHKQLVSWEKHLQGGDGARGGVPASCLAHNPAGLVCREPLEDFHSPLFPIQFSLLDFGADLLPGTRCVRQRMRNSLGASLV